VSLSLPLPPPSRERRQAAAKTATTAGGAAAELSEGEAATVAALKRWRLEQAREQGVPPYVVFHDRTLLEIASRRPANLDDLAAVGGVGRAKLERYGLGLLDLLAGLAEPPSPSPSPFAS